VNQNEDDAWLDALAGRIDVSQRHSETVDGSGDAPTSRSLVLEALALREFIRRQELASATAVPAVDPARESELIARARREGLLVSQTRAAGSRFSQQGPRWRMAIPTAAVILIAAGIGFWQSSLKQPESVRGIDQGTIHIQAADPTAFRRQLTEELRTAGATVTDYERFGRLGMDVDLPKPLPKAIDEILKRHHIPIPSDGVLVIEVEAPDSR
jgi:hypothetical protein